VGFLLLSGSQHGWWPPLATLHKISTSDPSSSDEVFDAFLEYCLGEGLELYGHQEEAILEVFAGKT
jgi:hypothetical protein